MPKYKNDKELADALTKEEVKRVMGQIPARYKDLKPLIEPLVKSAVDGLNGDLANEIAKFIRDNLAGVKDSQNLQVGKCDIARFYALTNGPQEDKYDPKKAIVIPVGTDRQDWGRDTYLFAGYRLTKSKPETMCIDPYDDHFLFAQSVLDAFAKNPALAGNKCEFRTGPVRTSPRAVSSGSGPEPRFDLIPTRILVSYSEDVTVGGKPMLSVTNYNANAWCSCEDQNPSGIISPGLSGSGTVEVTDSNSVSGSFPWRNSTASLGVTKIGEAKWQAIITMNSFRVDGRNFHDSFGRIDMRFFNPPNRFNTQTIGITVDVNPGCMSPAGYQGFTGSALEAGTNFGGSPTNPFQPLKQYYVGADNGSLAIFVGGQLDIFPAGTSNCALTATVELLDGPPPAQ